MNREQTLALYAQGRKAWNAWAEKMLAQKAGLEKALTLKAGGDAAKGWEQAATADFSTDENPHTFSEDAHFSGWVFPGETRFIGAKFAGKAGFIGAKFSGPARFGDVEFSSQARFVGVTFSGSAYFPDTKFSGSADFDDTKFLGHAWFIGAKFAGNTGFIGTKFSGYADFDDAKFSGKVCFQSATFEGFTSFEFSTFGRDLICTTARFEGPADFSHAVFEKEADFSSVKSKVGFTLSDASFARVPDLLQTEFHREPRLDNVRVRRTWVGPQLNWRSWRRTPPERPFPPSSQTHSAPTLIQRLRSAWTFIRQIQLPFTIDRDAPAKFRELKNYAIKGEDTPRELEFHAQEIRTSRFVSDWPWPWPVRFWFGYLYSIFSAFGRSLFRPGVTWAVLILVFAALHLGENATVAAARRQAGAEGWWSGAQAYVTTTYDAWQTASPCETRQPTLQPVVRDSTNAPREALLLALSNALVIFTESGSEAARRVYGCLYGLEQDGDNTVAVVPSFVSFWSTIQKMLSAVLIFLFGLGLRNMLKLK